MSEPEKVHPGNMNDFNHGSKENSSCPTQYIFTLEKVISIDEFIKLFTEYLKGKKVELFPIDKEEYSIKLKASAKNVSGLQYFESALETGELNWKYFSAKYMYIQSCVYATGLSNNRGEEVSHMFFNIYVNPQNKYEIVTSVFKDFTYLLAEKCSTMVTFSSLLSGGDLDKYGMQRLEELSLRMFNTEFKNIDVSEGSPFERWITGIYYQDYINYITKYHRYTEDMSAERKQDVYSATQDKLNFIKNHHKISLSDGHPIEMLKYFFVSSNKNIRNTPIETYERPVALFETEGHFINFNTYTKKFVKINEFVTEIIESEMGEVYRKMLLASQLNKDVANTNGVKINEKDITEKIVRVNALMRKYKGKYFIRHFVLTNMFSD